MKKIFVFAFFWFALISEATNPKIILYDDRGTWDAGVENLVNFLEEHQFQFEIADHRQILGGFLQKERPDLLIMPGGESWVYLEDLREEGAQSIRHFVNAGGSYLGICAGAFYATSHREGGAATGPYGIGLLEGVAVDGTSLEKPGFVEGVMDFLWELGNPFVGGLGTQVKMLLYGGPAFRFSSEESSKKQIEVLLRFAVSSEPAMIRFKYGKGAVFLSAPHFEIREEKGEVPQHDLSWPFLRRVIQSLISH